MRHRCALATVVVITAVTIASCSHNDGRTMKPPGGGQSGTIEEPSTTFAGEVVSPGEDAMTVSGPWLEGGSIETRYTCKGRNASPPLNWTGIVPGAVTLAVILRDEDAPEFTHWVLANIPATATRLAENESIPTAAPALNSSGVEGYTGPCPPKGTTHTYTLTLYAVSQQLEVLPGDPAEQMTAAIEAAAVGAASTSFTFSR